MNDQTVCLTCGYPMNPKEAVCPICGENIHEEYLVIRNYIKKYPNSNAMQIANATGISVSQILRFIKDGSLTMVHPDEHKTR